MRSLLLTWFLVALSVAGDIESIAADDALRFEEDVLPVLETKCVSCHGPEKQEGGLRLDSLANAKDGGDRGPAVVPGDIEKSLLVKAITFRDPDLQMPPKQKLSDKEIAILTTWIKSGAAWPESNEKLDEKDSRSAGDAFTDKRNPIRKLFRGERLDLWSLKQPRHHVSQSRGVRENAGDVPGHPSKVASRSGQRDDEGHRIDDFIRERLAKEKLDLAPEADRRTLIRRLTFDLTGLPPSVNDVAAFVGDQSPNAYQKLVERLLNSPRYGERQARLWLDVVRYADTNGYERDEFRPLMWQYRDYVIRSFNQDKPFDQFIIEQLAGDEIVKGTPETAAQADMLIATGFLRLGQWDSTASIFQEEPRLHAEMMADITNTTASAFLGLTMSCCQCHDHKYDPLSQADHFRFRAFFAGITPRDDLAISLADEQAEINKLNANLDQQAAPLKDEQAKLDKANTQRHDELKAKIAEIESKKRQPRRAMGVTESASPAATHIFYQGDFSSPRDEVQPGIPSVLGTFDRRGSLREPTRLIVERSTAIDSRRLKLASWIASSENPWTARVIVNRIWQQHFGTGLVATPNDFGYSGARPTHPELLDWLALEFVKSGWSIKELHRLIVTSATYRQRSTVGSAESDLQTSRLLYGMQNVRRLDAETLRDALLSVSGLLKHYDTGKPLWPPVPDELLKAQPAILEAEKGGDGGRMQGWYADPIEQTDVRSVFLVRKRCLPIPFLQAFDLPDTTVSCARRDTTVVAPQALMLLNSDEGVRYARAFADRVLSSQPITSFDDLATTNKLINVIFQQAIQRAATSEELILATEFLRRHQTQYTVNRSATQATKLAVTDLCRAILNLNEFAYLD